MCLTVDVCNSPTGAAFLFVLPLLVWQLADDNRWRALITSSRCKMNSYPASSRGIFTVGREAGNRGGGGRGGGGGRQNAPLLGFKWSSSPLSISLTHAPECAHTSTQARALRAALHFTFMGQKTGALI